MRACLERAAERPEHPAHRAAGPDEQADLLGADDLHVGPAGDGEIAGHRRRAARRRCPRPRWAAAVPIGPSQPARSTEWRREPDRRRRFGSFVDRRETRAVLDATADRTRPARELVAHELQHRLLVGRVDDPPDGDAGGRIGSEGRRHGEVDADSPAR